jgi:hypothetical protein
MRLYVDKTDREDWETEIFMDINLTHYPLRDYKGLWNEMQDIVKSYNGLGKRNSHALTHDKIGKHMMHLVRLNFMCLDILEKGEIITYREKEHGLLMDIRNGKYLDSNDQPTEEFHELLHNLEDRLEYAKANTALPEKPDYEGIREFVADVSERIVRGDYEEKEFGFLQSRFGSLEVEPDGRLSRQGKYYGKRNSDTKCTRTVGTA